MRKVYFDENTSPNICKALHQLESRKREIEVIHTGEVFGRGVSDEVIAKKVHQNDGILFSQDNDFLKLKVIVDIIKDYPIGLFYFKQPKGNIILGSCENLYEMLARFTVSNSKTGSTLLF